MQSIFNTFQRAGVHTVVFAAFILSGPGLFAQALPGDACADAINIDSLFHGSQNVPRVSGVYDNTGFTAVGDPATGHDCFADDPDLNNSMWYSFIGDGKIYRVRSVQCNATNYIDQGNTQGAIYAGNCANLTPVACSENQATGVLNFSIQLATTPGTEYRMLVDGYFAPGFSAIGEFCVEVTNLSSTAVTEIGQAGIRLYPNPTTGEVHLSGVQAERVDVYDATGRLALQISQPGNAFQVTGLPAGLYYLKIGADDGVYSAQVVKQ